MGRHGAWNESKATSAIAFLREHFPQFAPRRILDMGCTAGFSTVPYAQAWPAAEVHGIDLSAPALRYGHARAESMGVAVHFSQQDAERTRFADAHFDLVVSHILLHETSLPAVRNIFRECRRLLRPGGLILHVEVPLHHSGLDPWRQFVADWHTQHNCEPFWGMLHDTDVRALVLEAGFAAEHLIDARLPDRVGTVFLTGSGWWAIGGRTSA
jgi:SAM-dependent methyltransferase